MKPLMKKVCVLLVLLAYVYITMHGSDDVKIFKKSNKTGYSVGPTLIIQVAIYIEWKKIEFPKEYYI